MRFRETEFLKTRSAAAVRERDAANARLSKQDTAISALKREMTRQLSENASLKSLPGKSRSCARIEQRGRKAG